MTDVQLFSSALWSIFLGFTGGLTRSMDDVEVYMVVILLQLFLNVVSGVDIGHFIRQVSLKIVPCGAIGHEIGF